MATTHGNEALMDSLYDVIIEHYHANLEYSILAFHDCYDIPAKASDKERIVRVGGSV